MTTNQRFGVAHLGVVAFLCLIGLLAQTACADLIWSGAGQSGTDPFGDQWLTQNGGFQSVTNWGMPGRSKGTAPFQGNVAVSEIDVTFFGLPAGVTVMNQPVASYQPTFNVTPFVVGDLWTYSISGNTVAFFPPPTSHVLNPGDRFFYYVPFTATVDFSTFHFQVTYNSVPEPAGVVLMLAGALLLGVRMLRSPRQREGRPMLRSAALESPSRLAR